MLLEITSHLVINAKPYIYYVLEFIWIDVTIATLISVFIEAVRRVC